MRLLLGREECRDPGQYLSVNGVAAQLTLPLLNNRSETRPGSDIVTKCHGNFKRTQTSLQDYAQMVPMRLKNAQLGQSAAKNTICCS